MMQGYAGLQGPTLNITAVMTVRVGVLLHRAVGHPGLPCVVVQPAAAQQLWNIANGHGILAGGPNTRQSR
jgi:hypothetical protein